MGAACKRSSSPIRSVVALLIAILLCGPLSGIAAVAGESPPTTPVATAATTAADEAGRFVTTLNLLPWSVAVLSHRLAGSCCWLQSDDGFVRLEWAQRRSSAGEAASSPGRPAEVLAADSRELRDLVHQRGSGWTVVLASDRTGTVNRWQEEWHKTPESLVAALRVVLSTLQQGPAALDAKRASLRTERTAWQPARRTAARRIELTEPLRLAEDAETEPQQRSNPDPEKQRTSWRRRLVERGDGRGGEGEILTLTWSVESAHPARLVVRSSRRPGVLRLGPVTRIAEVSCLTPEVFVPLWPLSDLVTLPR